MRRGTTGRLIVETAAEMAFNGRDGCGCQGCMTMVFVLLVLTALISAHRHELVRAAAIGIGGVSALFLAREALRRTSSPRKKRSKPVLTDLPTPLAKIAPGVVHTAGLVGMNQTPFPVPLEGAPCVFFRVAITDDGSPLLDTRSSDEIVLEDGAGAALTVKLDDAKWNLERVHEIDSLPSAPNAMLDKYLEDRGLAARGVVHARVDWIAPHELVFVRGTVAQIGEDAADYRTSERASFVMTAATIALHEAPKG